MAQIAIETSQARSAVNSIKQKGNNARDIINQVDREIKAVEAWWKGERADQDIARQIRR